MHKHTFIAAIVVLVTVGLLIVGCGSGPSLPSTGETVTVFDKDGTSIEIDQPVDEVISVNSGMTALIYALGRGDKLVGRDAFSTFPSYAVENVEVVAKSSAKCNLELMISKAPDVVVADAMFYPQNQEKLDAAGIPSYVDSTSDPERLVPLIQNLGLMLGAEDKAEQLVQFVTQQVDIVDQRIARLELEGEDKPRVFFEWNSPLKTANAETAFHRPIAQAGGINIAADQPVRTPDMSSEWVIQQNPDVIVNRISGDATLEEMQKTRAEIMNRLGWENINAVKNNRVYIIKADVLLTFRYPVGLLYYATWFHPELFQDIDPEAIHREVVETFFGEEEWEMLNRHETFVYPEPSE
jgi:iron complex transport system substrate-binding protein